jgi:hypothetical protein
MRTNMGRAVCAPLTMSLCVCLAAALTACGGGTEESADTASASQADASSAQAVDTTSSAQAINQRNLIALPQPVQPTPIVATGTMTVAWAAPATSADGLKMADLAGYRVYYGTSSGNYTSTINVPGGTTLSYTISGLPTSTYYVMVKAYDSSNNESSSSGEVSKAVR